MKIESPDHKNQAKTFKNQDQCFGAAVSGATYRISHIYLYNKEKTCFFVRPSTFYIFHYFSKSIVANGKIIIEIGFNNYKECKWKKIFEK